MALVATLVSVLFYPSIWQQVVAPEDPNVLVIQGESPNFEFVAETVRLNILAGKNPFAATDVGMFPHGWKFAMDDIGPINGFYYVFTRPFFSTHQSLMLVTLMTVIVGTVLMDTLLIELGIRSIIAGVMALVFAFTPLVSARIGAHQIYASLYVFPWSALIIFQMIRNRKVGWRAVLMLGISWTVMVLTNLNYTLMWGVMLLGLWGWGWIYYRESLWKLTIAKGKYLVGAGIIALIMLSPWIREVIKVWQYEPANQQTNQSDVIAYSANLIHYVIPSKYNPTYTRLTGLIQTKYPELSKTIENFIYPGLIVIILSLGYIFVARKLPHRLKPIFGMAITFFLFSLGPKLQIGNYIVNVPLPYSLIAHIPYIQMARAPARFVVPMIFLMTIIAGYVIQFCYLRIRKSLRWGLLLILVIIFWFDQRTVPKVATNEPVPSGIYQYLKMSGSSPLLELPFAVRDGVKYHGYLHAHWNPVETLTHKRPIFGVYAGRINNPTFEYFAQNPLLGPLGRVIDSATSDPQQVIDGIERKQMIRALDFYRIEHALLKNNEGYSEGMGKLLAELQFGEIMQDQGYALWEREPKDLDIREIRFGGQDEDLTLLTGWSPPEPGTNSRWAMTNEAEVILSFQPKEQMKLVVVGLPLLRAQKVTVLINDELSGKMTFPGGVESRQELTITQGLKTGVNKISLQFAHTTIPAKSWRYKSQDMRPLALKISYVGIEE